MTTVQRKVQLLVATLLLSGCQWADETNAELLVSYKADCAARGYENIKVTYVGNLISSYYTCM